MKPLEQALNDYLSIRRSLGFRFQAQASLLRSFVVFLQAEGAPYITTELALRWATQPAKAQPSTWARAFGHGPALRHLAAALSTLAPRFPCRTFSLIVTGASLLTSIAMKRSKGSFAKPNNSPLPRDCAPTPIRLFSVLLVVTGMRVSEAPWLGSTGYRLRPGNTSHSAVEVRKIALCADSSLAR